MPSDLLRTGSYNIRDTMSPGKAEHSLRAFLGHVDAGALQEFGGHGRQAILHDLEREGWDHYRAPKGPVVLWRHGVAKKHDGCSVLLAEGRRVGFVPGRRTVLPDYHGTSLDLQHHLTGRVFRVVDVHTPAHVEIAGHLRPGKRAAMYRDTIRATIRELDDFDGPAFAAGDFNFNLRHKNGYPVAQMREAGYRSLWAGHDHIHGTLGRRPVDGIFSNVPAVHAHVLTSVHGSDHLPVVGTYRL